MNENKNPMRRVAILATLGAEPYRLGIRYEHRDAWRGALEMGIDGFSAIITKIEGQADLTVGSVLAMIVTSDLGPLAQFGEATLHQRRADAYDADCASWEAQPAKMKEGTWRGKVPSRNQRMLMIRMAITLNVPLPGDVTRGEAADWITGHGGNPNYSKEN